MWLFRFILSFSLVAGSIALVAQNGMYTGKAGTASFTSDAPLELISAQSAQLSGAINPETGSLAFSVRINSFQGFNSSVQREHFMENYMESTKYPVATFSGKLIETIPFSEQGQYQVRVKGVLAIHGVSVERIIPGTLIISKDALEIHAAFTVPLKDHDINVPKLLSQKIAESIFVAIDMTLEKSE